MELMEEIPNAPPYSDDLGCQQRLAIFQNIGWLLLLVLLLAAAFGVFGSGAYSSRTEAADGSWLKYERVIRQDAPTRLEVSFSRSGTNDSIALSLNQSYLEKFAIEKIIPEPTTSQITSEGVRWTFLLHGATNGAVILDVEAKEIGVADADLKVGDESLHFRQRILP